MLSVGAWALLTTACERRDLKETDHELAAFENAACPNGVIHLPVDGDSDAGVIDASADIGTEDASADTGKEDATPRKKQVGKPVGTRKINKDAGSIIDKFRKLTDAGSSGSHARSSSDGGLDDTGVHDAKNSDAGISPPPIGPQRLSDAFLVARVSMLQVSEVPLFSVDPPREVIPPPPSRDADAGTQTKPLMPTLPIIEGRDGVVRVFIRESECLIRDGSNAEIDGTVRLAIFDGQTVRTEEQHFVSDGSDDVSVDFQLQADDVDDDTAISAWVLRHDDVAAELATHAARFPAEGGWHTLSTEDNGGIDVVLVPVTYNGDMSGRRPTVDAAEVQKWEKLLHAILPADSVRVTVHPHRRSSR